MPPISSSGQTLPPNAQTYGRVEPLTPHPQTRTGSPYPYGWNSSVQPGPYTAPRPQAGSERNSPPKYLPPVPPKDRGRIFLSELHRDARRTHSYQWSLGVLQELTRPISKFSTHVSTLSLFSHAAHGNVDAFLQTRVEGGRYDYIKRETGKTLAHYVASNPQARGNAAICGLILNTADIHGKMAPLNVVNRHGDTPVMTAIKHENYEFLAQLEEYLREAPGCSLGMTEASWNSMLDYARQNSREPERMLPQIWRLQQAAPDWNDPYSSSRPITGNPYAAHQAPRPAPRTHSPELDELRSVYADLAHMTDAELSAYVRDQEKELAQWQSQPRQSQLRHPATSTHIRGGAPETQQLPKFETKPFSVRPTERRNSAPVILSAAAVRPTLSEKGAGSSISSLAGGQNPATPRIHPDNKRKDASTQTTRDTASQTMETAFPRKRMAPTPTQLSMGPTVTAEFASKIPDSSDQYGSNNSPNPTRNSPVYRFPPNGDHVFRPLSPRIGSVSPSVVTEMAGVQPRHTPPLSPLRNEIVSIRPQRDSHQPTGAFTYSTQIEIRTPRKADGYREMPPFIIQTSEASKIPPAPPLPPL